MEENLTVVGVLAIKKSAFSSSLLSSMVLFQDPAYILIACMGAFVSMGSAHYDYVKLKQAREQEGLVCEKNLFMELTKSFMVGAIFSLLSFMVFLQAGGETIKDATGLDWIDKMLPSFWLVVTVALATEAVAIWDRCKDKLSGWLK